MLKRQSKVLSIALIFVFCMSFMFAGFAAPQAAQAAATYQALSTPIVTANGGAQDLGVIRVDLPSCAAVTAGDVLTISLPSDVTFQGAVFTSATAGAGAAALSATLGAAPAATATPAGLAGSGAAAAGVAPADIAKVTADLTAAFTANAPAAIYAAVAPINGSAGATTVAAMTTGVNASIASIVTAAINADTTLAAATVAALPAIIAAVQADATVAADIAAWVPVVNTNAPITALSNSIAEVVIPATLDGNPAGPVNGLVAATTNSVGAVPNTPTTGVASARVTPNLTALDITMTGNGGPTAGVMYIYLTNMNIGSVDGDISANILAPANSGFTPGNVVVGKSVSSSGPTVANVLSVKSIGGTGACDVISVVETTPGTIALGNAAAGTGNWIKVKLPVGFSWSTPGAFGAGGWGGTLSWGFAAAAPAGSVPAILVDPTDNRILRVSVPAATTSATKSGRVNFMATINADDSVAKTGEVSVHISDINGKVTETDLVIAKYGTYGAKVFEGTKKDLVAGKYCQKIGEFYIEEDIANSLVNGRNIKFTLPKGVRWTGDYHAANSGLPATMGTTVVSEKGGVTLGAYTTADTETTLKTIVTQPAAPVNAAKLKFKDLKVDVAPDFTGPVTLTVSGTAGVSGEVVIAEVKPAVEMSAEDVKNVRIGEQNQELGTLIIKESAKENIKLIVDRINLWDGTNIPQNNGAELTLTLPTGAEWSAGYPTVEVTEGDLQLKTKSMSKVGNVLTIPIKSEGTQPSTIKVSGMKATLHRTVPEGDFKIAVSGTAINETGGQLINNANNLVGLAFPQYETVKVAVANCVTPAPNEGTTGAAAGQFKIGSNIYEVNGVSKIAGTAPYIKDGRTFVPVRYLGYALGVAEADVVWDEASQKVTLTKGDNVVELTIGSTTITVNGEALTMEVAPEITNDYTMLPARYVAEGLGYEVGWDPGTQTVLLSAK